MIKRARPLIGVGGATLAIHNLYGIVAYHEVYFLPKRNFSYLIAQ